jgi:cytochrome P450
MTIETQPAPAFPMPRTCPHAPPAGYGPLRDQGAVVPVTLPDGGRSWVVTRHAEVRFVLSDPRFSADAMRPGFPLGRLVNGGGVPLTTRTRPFMRTDPPEHTRLRRMLHAEFSVKRLEALRPVIQRFVDELVDAMAGGGRTADLVPALSEPLQSKVFCELLGVPGEDRLLFQERTEAWVLRTSTVEQRQRAVEDLMTYLDDLVSERIARPTDDLIGRLVTDYHQTGALHRDQLVSSVRVLLTAGHDTTANMISLGVFTLLTEPELRARLTADPALLPNAVEELLRFHTPVDFITARLALEDVEVGGQLVRAGEGVFALCASANRDERAFPDPDRLDISRRARHHVAFGFGPHQCLGQNLTRIELQIVYRTLFERLPELRLAAEVADLPFKHDGFAFGLYSLPVAW